MIFKSDTMDFNIVDAVVFLTFKKFSKYPFVKHSFSTRLGGVSTGVYTSMNLNFNRGDRQANVKENFRRICKAVGYDPESLVAGAQDHGTNIRKVGRQHRGIGIYKPKDMMSVDGLVTDEKNVTLVTYYADCVPLFFFDPNRKVVGLAHAGWKGTVGRIAQKMVEKMNHEYSSNPKDIVVGIAPSIAPCCYEVDTEVAKQFLDLSDIDTTRFVSEVDNEKYRINLQEANRLLLTAAGVPKENIVVSDLCTRCCHDLLISHRATNGKRGGMAAMIALNEE